MSPRLVPCKSMKMFLAYAGLTLILNSIQIAVTPFLLLEQPSTPSTQPFWVRAKKYHLKSGELDRVLWN